LQATQGGTHGDHDESLRVYQRSFDVRGVGLVWALELDPGPHRRWKPPQQPGALHPSGSRDPHALGLLLGQRCAGIACPEQPNLRPELWPSYRRAAFGTCCCNARIFFSEYSVRRRQRQYWARHAQAVLPSIRPDRPMPQRQQPVVRSCSIAARGILELSPSISLARFLQTPAGCKRT